MIVVIALTRRRLIKPIHVFEPAVLENLGDGYSLIWLYDKHLLDQVARLRTNLHGILKIAFEYLGI